MTRLAFVRVGGSSDHWEACGFTVDHDRIALANGALAFCDPDGVGLIGLAVDGFDGSSAEVEGIELALGSAVAGVDHPNGAFELDHVVVMTDSLERTSAAIAETLGMESRRVRETDTVRQGFHRFDDQGGVRGCIVEVVESDRAERSGLWGLVVNVVDLDATIAHLGPDRVGPARPAVQPGRRIATVRREAGLGVPLALMTPAT